MKGTICINNSIFNVELNSASEISQKSTTFRAIVVLSENYHPSKIGGLAWNEKRGFIIPKFIAKFKQLTGPFHQA